MTTYSPGPVKQMLSFLTNYFFSRALLLFAFQPSISCIFPSAAPSQSFLPPPPASLFSSMSIMKICFVVSLFLFFFYLQPPQADSWCHSPDECVCSSNVYPHWGTQAELSPGPLATLLMHKHTHTHIHGTRQFNFQIRCLLNMGKQTRHQNETEICCRGNHLAFYLWSFTALFSDIFVPPISWKHEWTSDTLLKMHIVTENVWKAPEQAKKKAFKTPHHIFLNASAHCFPLQLRKKPVI